ncbi:hypothetical protein [Egicoccus halophilus]|uniref:Uncharacterized protein n=1 Tax=Egicoccus halophilus TaxID=1670830 RepID=A0A8J3A729_9ACTN|nr:hypothetical protein [Egicoccus halophilus]GGI02807.1 hypothetical protein GCM10011354_01610 [Egicoccus halophilus]
MCGCATTGELRARLDALEASYPDTLAKLQALDDDGLRADLARLDAETMAPPASMAPPHLDDLAT